MKGDCRERDGGEVVVGEDALVVIAELLYQSMREDQRLARHFRFLDIVAFASCLRQFLMSVFDGNEWPCLRISEDLLFCTYDGFVDALLECLNRPIPLGEEVLPTGMNVLCVEKLGDHRVWLFTESIRMMSLGSGAKDPGSLSPPVVNALSRDYDAVLVGEDALVATADLLYQRMRADGRLVQYFRHADMVALASSLRRLLLGAFDGGEWPHVHVSKDLMDSTYEGLISVLLECIDRPIPLGSDIISHGFDVLCSEKWKDNRVRRFMAKIRQESFRPPDQAPVGATLYGKKQWNTVEAVEVVWNWVCKWFD